MSQIKISKKEVTDIFNKPLFELVSKAHSIHQSYFKNEVQAASLLSVKTGGCPENCTYCPQSAHYKTNVNKSPLLSKDEVLASAKNAKSAGATRFCMGAAWREVKDGPQFDFILELVKEVRQLNLEVCCTLGMLTLDQAKKLKESGLHAYNHNLDTSRNHYEKIIQTRTYDDRLQTIQNVRHAGLTVCTGGILGLGETISDRIDFIFELCSLDPLPESITINTLVPIKGTPLENQPQLQPFELLRVIATLRILSPASSIRLSAGRMSLSDETQFLCFLAGANSIFLGDKLLTSPNPTLSNDHSLLNKIGLKLKEPSENIESSKSFHQMDETQMI